MAATTQSLIGGDVPGVFGSRDGLASVARKTYEGQLDALPIHLQLSADEVEVYGGFATPQWINTVAFNAETLDWLLHELNHLDQLIEPDFYFQSDSNGTLLDLYLDQEIELEDGSALGLATPNYLVSSTASQDEFRWWEVFLNTPDLLADPSQLRYALIHEIGHTFGLEHPFEDNDGDVWGSIFSWPDGSQTVMSYTEPASGWPTVFSPLDYAALATLWGLESDHSTGWYFREIDGRQVGPLSTTLAQQRLAEERLNEQLVGPAPVPIDPAPEYRLVSAELLEPDAPQGSAVLQPQGADLIYFGFTEQAHSDPAFIDQARSSLAFLDDLIELDFVELADLQSPLLQLSITRGSSSDYDSDDGVVWLQRDSSDFDGSSASVVHQPDISLAIDTLNPYYQNLQLFDSRADYLNYALLHALSLSLGLEHPWSRDSLDASAFSVHDSVLARYASSPVNDQPLTALDRDVLIQAFGAEQERWQSTDLTRTPLLSLSLRALHLDESDSISAVELELVRSVNSAPDVVVTLDQLSLLPNGSSQIVDSVDHSLASGVDQRTVLQNFSGSPASLLRFGLSNPIQSSLDSSLSTLALTAPQPLLSLSDPGSLYRSPGVAVDLDELVPSDLNPDLDLSFSFHYNAAAFTPLIPADLAGSVVIAPDHENLDLDPSTSHTLHLPQQVVEASFADSENTNPSIQFVSTSDRFDPLTGQPIASPFRIHYDDPSLGARVVLPGLDLSTFHLDVDGDGRATALGDGLMIVRKLFGPAFAGSALTSRAISAQATRTSAEIHAFIQHGIDTQLLDVDRDGRVTALGDGLMIIRSLFGSAFSGSSLVRRAISPDSPLLASQDPDPLSSAATAVAGAIASLTPAEL